MGESLYSEVWRGQGKGAVWWGSIFRRPGGPSVLRSNPPWVMVTGPTCKQTHTTENITFQKLRWLAVLNSCVRSLSAFLFVGEMRPLSHGKCGHQSHRKCTRLNEWSLSIWLKDRFITACVLCKYVSSTEICCRWAWKDFQFWLAYC